jgi:hypothetical protein
MVCLHHRLSSGGQAGTQSSQRYDMFNKVLRKSNLELLFLSVQFSLLILEAENRSSPPLLWHVLSTAVCCFARKAGPVFAETQRLSVPWS